MNESQCGALALHGMEQLAEPVGEPVSSVLAKFQPERDANCQHQRGSRCVARHLSDRPYGLGCPASASLVQAIRICLSWQKRVAGIRPS
jgi:hypothetical protein